jgi:hypothetical protein
MTYLFRPPNIHELNWFWIAVMAIGPPLAGGLVALPFWRSRATIGGNLAGTLVIFGAAFALIVREYVELDRLMEQCVDAGFLCLPEPSAFARYSIYSFIALFEVVLLFTISLKVERAIRNRDYAPEWR